jgi:hypothetical protein
MDDDIQILPGPVPPMPAPPAFSVGEKVATNQDLLQCPICLELPFHAMMGKCGHTLCQMCKEKTGSVCPLCRKRTVYAPNYMVREIIQRPEYKTEYDKCEERYVLGTPKGKFKHLARQYKDFRVYNTNLPVEEQLFLVLGIHQYLQGQIQGFDALRRWYTNEMTIIRCKAEGLQYSTNHGKRYYFEVILGGWFFYFESPKKYFVNKDIIAQYVF